MRRRLERHIIIRQMDVVKLRLGRPGGIIATRPLRRTRRRVTVSVSAHGREENRRSVEMVGLGNLCIDVRLAVSRLPRQRPGWRHTLMQEFAQHPPAHAIYEPGGIMNTLIAGSRLGLDAMAVGRLGVDHHGRFCRTCLEQEGIPYVNGFDAEPRRDLTPHSLVNETSVCLVIVDSSQRHLFCSTFQVEPGPVFHHPSNFTALALQQIREAKALFMNGYAFQECTGEMLKYAFDEAIQAQTATFFDPGPYGTKMANGSDGQRRELQEIMHRSHVVLATEEEAMAVTATSDAVEAGRNMMQHPNSVTQWVVIKLGANGSLFLQRDVAEVKYTAGFPVHVSDTVGCGDSFGAAVVYGYLRRQGERPDGVMELANAIGAITATKQGAGRNVANLEDVKALLERQRKECAGRNGHVGMGAALHLLKMGEHMHQRHQDRSHRVDPSSLTSQTQQRCFG